jgi:hypothetical protein
MTGTSGCETITQMTAVLVKFLSSFPGLENKVEDVMTSPFFPLQLTQPSSSSLLSLVPLGLSNSSILVNYSHLYFVIFDMVLSLFAAVLFISSRAEYWFLEGNCRTGGS